MAEPIDDEQVCGGGKPWDDCAAGRVWCEICDEFNTTEWREAEEGDAERLGESL